MYADVADTDSEVVIPRLALRRSQRLLAKPAAPTAGHTGGTPMSPEWLSGTGSTGGTMTGGRLRGQHREIG